MQRIITATADPNGNGTGKAGFVNGTPPSVPPTQLDQTWFNQIQEEVCNAIESNAGLLNSASKAQLLKTIQRLARLYGGQANGSHIIRTYQRVQPLGMAATCGGVAFSPELGRIVMIYQSSQQVSYSDDGGIKWTHSASALPSARVWQSVCWANTLNMFVAVASDGTAAQMIATSSDGIVWTVRTAPSTAAWQCVRWGQSAGILVAVAYGSGTAGQQIMTSVNGTAWTIQTNPAPYTGTTLSFRGLCWAPTAGPLEAGLFCAFGNSGICATSPDGVTWTRQTTGIVSWSWNSVAWSDELRLFCAVNGDSTAAAKIVTSSDGVTWVARTGPDGGAWGCMIWNKWLGVFTMFGATNTTLGTSFISHSYDGITWYVVQLNNPHPTNNPVVGSSAFQGRGDNAVAMPEWGRNIAGNTNSSSTIGIILTSDSDRPLVMGMGVTDGSTPGSGEVGEIVEAQLLAASASARGTGTNASAVVTIALPPGDWDISGIVNVLGSPTGFTALSVAPSLVSGSAHGIEAEGALNKSIPPTTTATGISLIMPTVRASNTGTSNVGLNVTTTYTGGTMTLYGKLRARRVR